MNQWSGFSASMNLYLTGYRGTGKTTVGKLLAERLSWDWIDVDRWIESQAGKTVAEIFAEQGEPTFRKLEVDAIAELSRRDQLVLSLGGGAILAEETRARLRNSGRVYWLDASPESIAERIGATLGKQGSRPSLTSHADPLAEIREVLAKRLPLYQEVSDCQVNTDGVEVIEVVNQIFNHFNASRST